MLFVFFCTLIASGFGIIVFIYYLSQGQFEDSEEVKYQLFREEKPPDVR